MKRKILITYRKIRNLILAKVYAIFGKLLMNLLYYTCKKEVTGLDNLLKGPCILALWHNRLSMIAPLLIEKAPHLTYAPFISNSRDGAPLAAIVSSYKQGRPIRVKHSAKHQGLKELIQTLQNENFIPIITPDGPRGPRCKVKPGIIACANATNTPIVPFSWEAKSHWELKTWDGFRIPKPFTTISYHFGKPQEFKHRSKEAINSLEEALNN